MTGEADFLSALRALATHPAARGFADDTAVLTVGGATLVLTHDMIVEGIHYLPGDPPADVAWKLVAVNLSDLGAKGAAPIGVLMGYSLRREPDWDARFVAGLGEALAHFGVPLLGGDTVSVPSGTPRSLGLTAIGEARGRVPARAGAQGGDVLWVTGTIGDAGAGLRRIAVGQPDGPLPDRYRRPLPRLAAGHRLAGLASAMMDVSDGLLIDAQRMAEASGVRIDIDLAALPLSPELIAFEGDDRQVRLAAATAGDDYELLFCTCDAAVQDVFAVAEELSLQMTRIGRVTGGSGLILHEQDDLIPLPDKLGWQHS
ncbi:thiamine-phosphate kinase [Sphingosinicella sp. BN140058]|uniref:thiamine-phosphate kinase n=1 Tax=Sphingosinicella sp. BN140058 TaxID=1892855 RepID=UPI00101279F2|nr:thiamine-phosphate kinase [Sphingosinicella sp. BN140058]QAY77074.1 thiamine-phosphate kinase [Sphingosinicella sp. BN140058]